MLFSAKAFLISAIIMAKIIYLDFLISRASEVALIIQISRVLSLFKLSIVSYIVSYLGLGLVLDLGLCSLSILSIVGYQSFQYFYVLSLSFYLVQGGVVVRVSLQGLVGILDPQQILVEFLYQWNLVESSRFLRYRVDISRNLRLVDLGRFPRFQFRVRVVYYKVLLLIIGGGKQKLKVIIINSYFIQLYLRLFKDYQVTQNSNKKLNQFFIVQVLESQGYCIGNIA